MECYDMHVQAERWRELARRSEDRTAAALREAADLLDARADEVERAERQGCTPARR
jgi:hypothetical protein